MLSSKETLRYLIDRQLGADRNPPPEKRLRDAIIARRCRNVFFGAMAPVVYGATVPDVIVDARTAPFADPIIVTDILNFNEPWTDDFEFTVDIRLIMRLFVTGLGAPEDFFGAGNYTNSVFTLGHYRTVQNATGRRWESPTTKMHFAPYLLRPGAVFQASWEYLDFDSDGNNRQGHPELHCRGLRVLRPEDSYGELCGRLRDDVCDYIKRYDPETFILHIRIPTASFPAAGGTASFVTPLQERPLLVLGMASNIIGAQVQIRDDSTQTNFVVSPTVPRMAMNGGVEVAGVYPNNIVGLPLYVAAADSDLTLHEAYNPLPVPHLLAPNTSLSFKLTNGLRPKGNAATFEQSMSTLNTFSVSTGDGYISLLCRTV